MRDAWASHEVWVYECLCCGVTWDEEFDAKHSGDGHGGEAVVYERGGQRCMTPWLDHACPACSSQNIKVFSAPWRRREAAARPARDDGLETVYRLRRLHAW